MSKQIRVDDQAYEELESMAKQVGFKPTTFNSTVILLFKQLFEELQQDGRLVIQKSDSEQVVFGLPFRVPRNLEKENGHSNN